MSLFDELYRAFKEQEANHKEFLKIWNERNPPHSEVQSYGNRTIGIWKFQTPSVAGGEVVWMWQTKPEDGLYDPHGMQVVPIQVAEAIMHMPYCESTDFL